MLEVDLLEPGYARLLRIIAGWAETHGTIQAMFVSGSVAEGTADAFSDLDLVVVVNQSNFIALLDEVRAVINDGEPVVLDYRLGIDVLCLITEDWHRIDLLLGGRTIRAFEEFAYGHRARELTFSRNCPEPIQIGLKRTRTEQL
jgi:predicted nucleotidyltransferase